MQVMQSTSPKTIERFNGLNNVTDPMRLGHGWLTKADNVNITDSGGMESRDGYTRVSSTPVSGMYSTLDFQRMYLIAGGELKSVDGTVLRSGLPNATMHWTEVNAQVFYNNGTDCGIIESDNSLLSLRWDVPAEPTVSIVAGDSQAGTYAVCLTTTLPDGRETGSGEIVTVSLAEGQGIQVSGVTPQYGCSTNVYLAPANSSVFQLAATTTYTAALNVPTNSDLLGRELQTLFMAPIPLNTEIIQVWRGRLFASQYMPGQDQTVVWFSEALGFHLFNLNSNYFIVPGKALMLAPHDDALIVGTDRKVFAYTVASLAEIADYGVVPGQHWAIDDKRILFWSVRGVCAALPFTNLTENQVSVAPGIRAGGCLIRSGGQKRFVAVLQQGGLPFNAL